MISVEEQGLRRKRQIVTAAGYTIQSSPAVSWLPPGWYALLPGETHFKDNSDSVEVDPSIAHEQNYLGFFSSEADLLDEVVPLANERLKRHVHLYAVARIKVCGLEGDDREAITSAVKAADVNRLLRQAMLSDEAQRTAQGEVAHVEFADEITHCLVDLIDQSGERVEGTEAYFEGAESPEIMLVGLFTDERAAHLLGKIVQAFAKGEPFDRMIGDAAELLKSRLPVETMQAFAAATTSAPASPARPKG